MALPITTSRKREQAITNALKQFNIEPIPIATEPVTTAFNNLRTKVAIRLVKLIFRNPPAPLID